MDLALFAIELILNIAAIILHSCGSVSLFYQQRRKISSTQTILILQLSLSELLLAVCNLLKLPVNWHHRNDSLEEKIKSEDHPVTYYLRAIQLTMILWVYHLSMIYLTCDRFLRVYLSLKYKMTITKRRVWCLSICTWMACALCCVVMLVVHRVHQFDYTEPIYNFLIPILQATFLLCAFVAYGYIILKFYGQKRKVKRLSTVITPVSLAVIEVKDDITSPTNSQRLEVCQSSQTCTSQPSQKKRNMKVYIPVLIIITFALFIVLPYWLIHFSHVTGENKVLYYQILLVLAEVNSIIDAGIYIFLQDTVRSRCTKLWKANIGLP